MSKSKYQSNLDFRFMSFFFKIRDKFHPPMEKIRKAEIKEGDIVLDYGCGPGSYTIAAAERVGENGNIFAADIHPLAIEKVKQKAKKLGFKHIETIQTDCDTGLKDESVDVVICFDVLHGIPDKNLLLREFHRVLKPNATLSVDDHHSEESKIIDTITAGNLFKLLDKKDKQFNFLKA